MNVKTKLKTALSTKLNNNKVSKVLNSISKASNTNPERLIGPSKSGIDIRLIINAVSTNNVLAIDLISQAFKSVYDVVLFDEQKTCALLLCEGQLVDMDTGEGKTYAIAASAILSAFGGKRVTIATENDYLVERDFLGCKPVFDLLGINTGVILSTSSKEERLEAYKADVIYSSVREIAYDYLRNNLVTNSTKIYSPIRDVLIIDEADSALVDHSTQMHTIDDPKLKTFMKMPFHQIWDFVSNSTISDHIGDESIHNFKSEQFTEDLIITEMGYKNLENELIKVKLLSNPDELYLPNNTYIIELVEAAAKAFFIFKQGVHYSVDSGKLCVLDAITGRAQHNIRLNNGLHQFIELKENLLLTKETASAFKISTQQLINLFPQYSGLSGSMTDNRAEFQAMYGKQVLKIPNHFKKQLLLLPERIFFQTSEKLKAAISTVIARHSTGQPILICTNNETDSNSLSDELSALGIKHNILISKKHKEEANILSSAGQQGAITITTSNAARGTDIPLGRTQACEKGMFLLGYGHQFLAKSDQQLLGRVARKGEKGGAQFFSSFEDDLFSDYEQLKKSLKPSQSFNANELNNRFARACFQLGLRKYHNNNRQNIAAQRSSASTLIGVIEPYRAMLYDLRLNLVLSKSDSEVKYLLSNYGGINFDAELPANSTILCIFDTLICEHNSIITDLRRSSVYSSYSGESSSYVLHKAMKKQCSEFFSLLKSELMIESSKSNEN